MTVVKCVCGQSWWRKIDPSQKNLNVKPKANSTGGDVTAENKPTILK